MYLFRQFVRPSHERACRYVRPTGMFLDLYIPVFGGVAHMGGYRHLAGEPFIVDFGIVHLAVTGGDDHLVAPDVCWADAVKQVSAVDQE